jgi:G3E family GTPase
MESIDHNITDTLRPIPVTILTGFLGAGKTTLLNRILNGDHGLKAAVLVNDFGSINIDADLVVGLENNVISLANGCICCTLRDDLVQTVMETIARPERPEYILLEASGVADPVSIAMTFNNPYLMDRIRMDSITCVLDAEQVFANPDYPAMMNLKLRQIASADLMVLNKVELAGAEQVEKVRKWIDYHFNNIRVVETNFCDVPYEILLAAGRFEPGQLSNADPVIENEDSHPPGRQPGFETWSYETMLPLSLDALEAVAKKLPGGVFRCKGIIQSAGDPDCPAVLQVVGRRVNISFLDHWAGRKRSTRIVTISAPGSVDFVALRRRFDSCIVQSVD